MSVRSIERAAAVMRSVALHPHGLTLTAISELTNLSKATAHRILHTLLSTEMLRVENGRYFAGNVLLMLAGNADPYAELKEAARVPMEQLCRKTSETVSLAVRRGLRRVVIAVCISPHELKAAPEVGSSKPIHAGAAGRALLAFLSDEECAKLLANYPFVRLASGTVTTRQELMQELQKLRQFGYAWSAEETVDGQAAIAVPILQGDDTVAAMHLHFPLSRASKQAMREWTPHVVAAANAVSTALKRTRGVREMHASQLPGKNIKSART